MEIHNTQKIIVIFILGYWRIPKAKQKAWLAVSFLIHIARNDICIFHFYTSPTKILLSAFVVNQTQSIYGSERPGFYPVWGICLSAEDVHLSTTLLYPKQ